MSNERIVRIAAGTIVLASLALTHYVHPNWWYLTAFVGANLFQSGFTKICPLEMVLKKIRGN